MESCSAKTKKGTTCKNAKRKNEEGCYLHNFCGVCLENKITSTFGCCFMKFCKQCRSHPSIVCCPGCRKIIPIQISDESTKDIIKSICYLMNRAQENLISKNYQIKMITNLFEFLIKPNCLQYIENNVDFKMVVKSKLVELYFYGFQDAGKYYEIIFNELMNV